MKHYRVQASGRVCYEVYVHAKSEEEAKRMVDMGEVELGEPNDSEDFAVDFVEEITKAGLYVEKNKTQ